MNRRQLLAATSSAFVLSTVCALLPLTARRLPMSLGENDEKPAPILVFDDAHHAARTFVAQRQPEFTLLNIDGDAYRFWRNRLLPRVLSQPRQTSIRIDAFTTYADFLLLKSCLAEQGVFVNAFGEERHPSGAGAVALWRWSVA